MSTYLGTFGAPGVPAPRALMLAVLALLLPALGAPAAQAGPLGALKVQGAIGYYRDDNLFRLPDDQPAFDNRRADSARYATAGLLFDKAIGRQKIFLQGKVSKVKFRHFRQLDYDGKDFLGLLNWQAGSRLKGSAGGSYVQTPAGYVDVRSRERNLRRHRRLHADAAWRLHPSWRVRGAAARDKFSYDLAAQRFSDRTEDAVEAGFEYEARSGSTAGLVARKVKGSYRNPNIVGGVVLNDDFTQDELKAKINWKASASSTVQLLAGYARRRHELPGARRARGFNGRLAASLNPRQKLRLNAAAWREFAPIESTLVTYSLNRGASAGATWDASYKLRVEGALSTERRRYEGHLLPIVPAGARDRLRSASLVATWSLRPGFQLSAGYARQRRDGAAFLGNGNFKSNTVSASASVLF